MAYFLCRLAPSRAVIAAKPSADIGGGARDGEVVYAGGLVKSRFNLSISGEVFFVAPNAPALVQSSDLCVPIRNKLPRFRHPHPSLSGVVACPQLKGLLDAP